MVSFLCVSIMTLTEADCVIGCVFVCTPFLSDASSTRKLLNAVKVSWCSEPSESSVKIWVLKYHRQQSASNVTCKYSYTSPAADPFPVSLLSSASTGVSFSGSPGRIIQPGLQMIARYQWMLGKVVLVRLWNTREWHTLRVSVWSNMSSQRYQSSMSNAVRRHIF